jgi:hypothetical protein
MPDTWNVTEILLEARYMVGDSDTLPLACRSLSLIPEQNYPPDISADGNQMFSVKTPATLEARGVELIALQSLKWEPTHITFRDVYTGEQKEFAMNSFSFEEPDKAKFVIAYAIATVV